MRSGGQHEALNVYDFSYLDKKSKDYFIDYEAALIEYDDFDGNPYLTDQPILVDLYLPDGRSYTPDVYIKYDLFNNEIIAWKLDGEKIILDLMFYSAIVGKGEHEGLVLKRNSNLEEGKFYEVLFERDGFFFLKESIKAISNTGSSMPGLKEKQSFERRKKYYVQSGGKIYTFKLKSNSLLDLPDFEGIDIDDELKKVGIKKLKKESHFIEFFDKVVKGKSKGKAKKI